MILCARVKTQTRGNEISAAFLRILRTRSHTCIIYIQRNSLRGVINSSLWQFAGTVINILGTCKS